MSRWIHGVCGVKSQKIQLPKVDVSSQILILLRLCRRCRTGFWLGKILSERERNREGGIEREERGIERVRGRKRRRERRGDFAGVRQPVTVKDGSPTMALWGRSRQCAVLAFSVLTIVHLAVISLYLFIPASRQNTLPSTKMHVSSVRRYVHRHPRFFGPTSSLS